MITEFVLMIAAALLVVFILRRCQKPSKSSKQMHDEMFSQETLEECIRDIEPLGYRIDHENSSSNQVKDLKTPSTCITGEVKNRVIEGTCFMQGEGLDGMYPYWFLLDTVASQTCVSNNVVEQLQFSRTGSKPIESATEVKQASLQSVIILLTPESDNFVDLQVDGICNVKDEQSKIPVPGKLFGPMEVVCFGARQGYDVILGMEVIERVKQLTINNGKYELLL